MYFIISNSSGRQKLKSASLQRDFTWIFLTHKEVGGILHGGWKIGARTWRDLAEIRTRSKVTPGIRDYVSSTMSDKETPELSYAEAKQAGLLANMDLLPRTGILQQNIYAPSVFSTSRWCRQRLTVSELMDIFDFEDCVKR